MMAEWRARTQCRATATPEAARPLRDRADLVLHHADERLQLLSQYRAVVSCRDLLHHLQCHAQGSMPLHRAKFGVLKPAVTAAYYLRWSAPSVLELQSGQGGVPFRSVPSRALGTGSRQQPSPARLHPHQRCRRSSRPPWLLSRMQTVAYSDVKCSCVRAEPSAVSCENICCESG